ncbi:MAG: hypothetical protein A3G76_13365 [Acidobacteria bacterium RIFCSPLOWO2_12_FULL_65_11]|nr:MAG: hypothetical protein A3H95_10790 [Acidobacteria bacterium RIFCSPLOWO2_02_FULL_64_15]OFW34040.1 MAG: hypothetical protein A3G76_13365 [Acidobacteria bacterium RIFCSPLOWO2_12_FULL_65_11]
MPLPTDEMTEPNRSVTRRELREELEYFFARNLEVFATKDDLKAFPTKNDPKGFATKDDLKGVRDELRDHFDAVAESFKDQFDRLFDWVHATTNSLAKRVETIEDGHGNRLLGLETRVTAIELGHAPKKREEG